MFLGGVLVECWWGVCKHPTMLKPQYIKGLREFWVGCGVLEAYEFLSVRYGDADTLLTTFQQFPRWE